MARSTTPSARSAGMTPGEMVAGITKIQRRIDELDSLILETSLEELKRKSNTLKTKIEDTLSQIFGIGTEEFERYKIFSLYSGGVIVMGGRRRPDSYYIGHYLEGIKNAKARLETAIAMLKERIEDSASDDTPITSEPAAYARKAFIVHGHDLACRKDVELFLRKLDFDYVVLNEQPNSGRTVIEKIEQHSDVGFAIVLLTPDDPCQSGAENEMRARQNVMWEYGYFVGRLGRSRVCVLKKGNVKIPSDLEGIGWTGFDETGKWQVELARELRGADYSIDMNKII